MVERSTKGRILRAGKVGSEQEVDRGVYLIYTESEWRKRNYDCLYKKFIRGFGVILVALALLLLIIAWSSNLDPDLYDVRNSAALMTIIMCFVILLLHWLTRRWLDREPLMGLYENGVQENRMFIPYEEIETIERNEGYLILTIRDYPLGPAFIPSRLLGDDGILELERRVGTEVSAL